MALIPVPGFASAPLEWHPAKSMNFDRGRSGRVPLGHVDHRMVGWLTGTRRYFTVSSERPVSTHFGIGHTGVGSLCAHCGPLTGAKGELVIDQYVDLADTAFGNGNSVPSASWPLVKLGLNENWITISTEHEDGATAGRGIVTPHVWAASIALDVALQTRPLAELRALGVRIGRASWHPSGTDVRIDRALKAIPVSELGYIDHHAIADYVKPFCFRRWLADPGFVPTRQAGKIAAIAAALKGDTVQRTFTFDATAKAGSFTIVGENHLYLRLLDGTPHPIAHGVTKRAFGPVTLVGGGFYGPADPRDRGYVIEAEAAFVIVADGTFTADTAGDANALVNETITRAKSAAGAALEALRPKP